MFSPRQILLIVAVLQATFSARVKANDTSGIDPTSKAHEAEQMLLRADSLLQHDRPVAALAMYRGAEERSFDPCQVASARLGIARIYVANLNHDLAFKALEMAENGLLACAELRRRDQALIASDLWMEMQTEDRALAILLRELKMNPEDLDVLSKVAHIQFVAGDWEAAAIHFRKCLDLGRNEVSRSEFAGENERLALAKIDWLGKLIQLEGIQKRVPNDSLVLAFEETALEIDQAAAQSVREQIHLVMVQSGMYSQALRWAEIILDFTDQSDPEQTAVAYLRFANDANRANRPLDALIGFHESIKSARSASDPLLLAEALRQKAEFEAKRGNHVDAFDALQEVDVIQMQWMEAQLNKPRREVREFTEQLLPEPDPFDRAVLEISAQQARRGGAGSWPWLAGLLGIGMIAMARSHRSLRENLSKERRRIIRLRSLVPADRLPGKQANEVVKTEDENEWGESSIMPNGAFVFTRDTNPRSQSIQLFLAELDEEMQSQIHWELNPDVQFSIGPKVRMVIRNLLGGVLELSPQDGPIQIEVSQETSHWTLCLNSSHTETSKALQGLFCGKDAIASSRWNELHAQLRQLTGKIHVERVSPLQERLIVTLPFL